MQPSIVFTIWDLTRNLANVALVALFIFVITAQALSYNVNKFGIKRLMPRIFAAAVLANLSYYILAFIIDAFNLFGAGVQGMLSGVLQSGGLQGNGIYSPGLFTVAGVGLAAVVINAGAALPWLFILLGMAALILLSAVIVLVVRQMIIIVIVFLSPLIFLCMVLDNTRPWYVRSRRLFFQLMFMAILIDACFVAGKLTGLLLTSGVFNNI